MNESRTDHIARRMAFAVIAGGLAVAVNMAMLAAADRIPLVTAHGGLLKFLIKLMAAPARAIDLGQYLKTLESVAGGKAFQAGFHVMVALSMAIFYAFCIEPFVRSKAWIKGLSFALAVWFANAFIVLPYIGEGFAGSKSTGNLGIFYFMISHIAFFVLTSEIYTRLMQSKKFRQN